MSGSKLRELSMEFSVDIIELVKYLKTAKESIISNQIGRSGTSIGANIKEAIRGESKLDFYHKMAIALKEASETAYWLELLHESGYISNVYFSAVYGECQEIIRILMAICKKRYTT